jgi:hypothetical protein
MACFYYLTGKVGGFSDFGYTLFIQQLGFFNNLKIQRKEIAT